VDLAKARSHRIKPGDVRRAEAALLQGIQVGSVFQQQKVFDVVVKGVPRTRRTVSDVRDLLIDRPGGGYVRLGEVADVRITPAPVAIQRDAVSRRVDVEAGVDGRSVRAVGDEIEDRLAKLGFPLEYHAEVLRETTGAEIGATRALAFAIAAAIASFLLLQAAFRSWRLAVLTCLVLPVALVGGVLAALLDGAELSLGSLIGFLALFGIAARNGVLLTHRLQELRRDEGETFGPRLVRWGARERLVPILASASALALLALPFAILGSRPGLEVLHPMAVVVIGGLVTSTLLSLLVLPVLYLRFGSAAPSPEPEAERHRWAGLEHRTVDGDEGTPRDTGGEGASPPEKGMVT
jgi:Cu/Ag efflux pump CusA